MTREFCKCMRMAQDGRKPSTLHHPLCEHYNEEYETFIGHLSYGALESTLHHGSIGAAFEATRNDLTEAIQEGYGLRALLSKGGDQQ